MASDRRKIMDLQAQVAALEADVNNLMERMGFMEKRMTSMESEHPKVGPAKAGQTKVPKAAANKKAAPADG